MVLDVTCGMIRAKIDQPAVASRHHKMARHPDLVRKHGDVDAGGRLDDRCVRQIGLRVQSDFRGEALLPIILLQLCGFICRRHRNSAEFEQMARTIVPDADHSGGNRRRIVRGHSPVDRTLNKKGHSGIERFGVLSIPEIEALLVLVDLETVDAVDVRVGIAQRPNQLLRLVLEHLGLVFNLFDLKIIPPVGHDRDRREQQKDGCKEPAANRQRQRAASPGRSDHLR